MTAKVLSQTQIDEFISRGWTRLERAYAPEDALAAQDFLWEKLRAQGIEKTDAATWTKPLVRLNENYGDAQFQACNTERLADAVEDLVGQGRWRERGTVPRWGGWPVNFPRGEGAVWDIPKGGWHWDGSHFRHSVDSPHQGLLLICCFSHVEPRGGGTLIASGSHNIVARLLASYPDGVEQPEALRKCIRSHPWLADLGGFSVDTIDASPASERVERFMNRSWTDENGTVLRVEEVTCEPGDVFLCHPFLYHAMSANITGAPRFMCNRTTPLTQPMQLQGDEDCSPLEESVRRALRISEPATV